MAVIDAWIGPGTTVISDWWGAYRDLDAQGYTHYTVNYTIGFVDQRTGAHTNTIESTWRHVKAYASPYNRKVNDIYHLAHYEFAAKCRAEKVHPFTRFLHLVASTDWNLCPPPLHHLAPSDLFFISGHLQLHGSTASLTTGTCACARRQQAIRDRGNFCVFSATTKNDGFTFGTDDLLRHTPGVVALR